MTLLLTNQLLTICNWRETRAG